MKVLDFALKVEEVGQTCLSRLSECAAYPGVRKVLAMLAEEQRDAARRLRELQSGTSDEETAELDAAAGSFRSIFDADVSELKSDLDAYRFGVTVEQKVAALFEEMAGSVSNSGARKLLRDVAEEERRHYETWLDLYDYVAAPSRTVVSPEFGCLPEE